MLSIPIGLALHAFAYECSEKESIPLYELLEPGGIQMGFVPSRGFLRRRVECFGGLELLQRFE